MTPKERAQLSARLAALDGLAQSVAEAWAREAQTAYPDLRAALGKRFNATAARAINTACLEVVSQPEVALRRLRASGYDALVVLLVARSWENLERQAAPQPGPMTVTMEDDRE